MNLGLALSLSSNRASFPPQKAGDATLALALMPGSIVSSGGVVTQWKDVSGHNRHATPSGSPALDTTQTFGAGVLLDGVNDTLTGSDSGGICTDQPCHIFLVHRMITAPLDGYHGVLDMSDTLVSDRSVWFNYAYGAPAVRMGDSATASYSDASTDVQVTRIDVSEYSRSVWRNGTYKAASGINTLPAKTIKNYRLGNRLSLDTLYYNGAIYAVLIYSGRMSEAALLSVEAKLLTMIGATPPFSWPIQNATSTSGDPRLILRDMDAIVGIPIRFDLDSLGYRDGYVERTITSTLDLNTNVASRVEVTPPAAGTYTLTVTEGSYSKTITITAHNLPSSDAKKYVFPWGDSNTEGMEQSLMEYIYTLLGTTQVAFVGGQAPAAGFHAYHEGHQGFTFGPVPGATGGFNQAGSPFWMGGGALDIPGYAATLSHAPTHMLINCGQNTAYGATEGNLEDWLTTDLGHATTLIQAMVAQWPGIKIGLMQCWPLNADISFWGTWASRLVYRRKMHRLAERLPELITANPGVDITIIPSFASVGIGVRPRNPWRDAIHLSPVGFEELISPVLGWLVSH